MVKLNRPAEPDYLYNRCFIETGLLWLPSEKVRIKKGVYGHKSVAKVLKAAQSDKCAYCETKIIRNYGAVEHFRPKDGWKQNKSDFLSKPGYFWLSYDWTNLLFTCEKCNDQGHKGNVFPIGNPTDRAHHLDPVILRERPLLLNPFEDDPYNHIRWSRHIPVGLTEAGLRTIEVFKLDSDESLVDERRTHFNRALDWLKLLSYHPRSSQSYRIALHNLKLSIADSSHYAGMIRGNFGPQIQGL